MKLTKAFWIIMATAIGAGFFVAGYGMGSGFSALSGASGKNAYENGFAAGMQNAKKIVEDGNYFPPEPDKITSVYGTIAGIDGENIVIKAAPVSPNPFSDQGPETRTVKAGAAKIFALVNKTAQEMNSDFKDFQNRSKTGTATPPSPIKEIPASLSDLKLTMAITVTASGDILDAAAIDAAKITFQTY